MSSQLLCERCNKKYLVLAPNSLLYCPDLDCHYTDANPLTYQNDINAYDAQDKVMNRFSEIYTPLEALAQNERFQCNNFQSNFFRGKKYIYDCGYTLRLNETICGEAAAMLTSILKALYEQKSKNNPTFDAEVSRQSEENEIEGEDKKKKGKGQRYKNKNIFAVRFLAAYSLQAVCFLKENYFEEYNIIREFRISLKEWRDINKQMNSLLRTYLNVVPTIQPKHIVMKVCKKRHINGVEQAAMVQMCERISKYSNADVRSHTIAAIAFWKVSQFSTRYHDRIDLKHICKSHDRLIQRGLANQTYGFFDITPENVKKVYKQYIRAEFHKKYLPQWSGRIEILDKKGNFIDFD